MDKGLSSDQPHIGTLASLFSEDLQVLSDVQALVELRIGGLARFLSHIDLMRTAERCCARAGLAVVYSQGFNPHPRLSMPLPKGVGLASEGDVLALRLDNRLGWDSTAVADALSGQWPAGIEVLSVRLVDPKDSLYPHSVDYRMCLLEGSRQDEVHAVAERVLAAEHLVVERMNPTKRHKARHIDIRPYWHAVVLTDREVEVTCGIDNSGTVRVEEILRCLGVTQEDLDGPVRRTHIRWRLN